MDERREAQHLRLVQTPSPVAASAPAAGSARGKPAPHVQLVRLPSDEPSVVPPDKHAHPHEQLSLFPAFEPKLLGVIHMKRIRARRFGELLRIVRPRWLIDLRPLPLFDIDQMNRRRAFAIFEECNIDYREVVSDLGIVTRQDASLTSGRVADAMSKLFASQASKAGPGPVVLLVDHDDVQRISMTVLPKQLRPKPKGDWVPRLLE